MSHFFATSRNERDIPKGHASNCCFKEEHGDALPLKSVEAEAQMLKVCSLAALAV